MRILYKNYIKMKNNRIRNLIAIVRIFLYSLKQFDSFIFDMLQKSLNWRLTWRKYNFQFYEIKKTVATSWYRDSWFHTVIMESRGSTGEYFQQNSVKSPVQKEHLITRYPSVGTSSGKSSRDEIAPSERRPLLHRRKCSYDRTTNRFQLYICRRAITNN